MLFCNRISKGEGMRKAKIIATMGPACEDERVLAEMVAAGMNVARFNMSHGDQASHKKQIDSVKRIRGRDKQHLRQIERHLYVMVAEGVVLLAVEDFKHCRRRITAHIV